MAIVNKDLATMKKPNQVEFVSKQVLMERLREIKKCREDIVYFAENYYRLQTPDGLKIIKPYEVQKELLRFIVDNNRAIVCSSRQLGKSTSYCIYVLWLTCFHADKRVMMLAQKEATALELLDRIKTGYTYLPTWLKPGCVEFNKSSVKFSNRSTIMGFSCSAQGARGQSCTCLILDEFSFVPNNIADDLFASVYPVVSASKQGKVIIVSTPNGKHNLYYELWKKANNKNDPDNKAGWKPFIMYWWQVPGRDEKWKQIQIQSIGPTRFAQEFNNEFLDDVQTVKLISDEIADKYRLQLTEFKQKQINQGKVLFIISANKKKTYSFKMYHDFDPKRTYLATSDIAEGVKKDSSVLYIWDITDTSNIRMCAKFSENDVSILEFAYITREILKLYADPFIACESNGISLGYIEQLRVTYGYDNFVRMNKGGSCGIDSQFQVKTRACLWCRDMMTIMGFGFEFYDLDLVDEFSSFVKKDLAVHTVYNAVKGAHDDHIISFIWMCWILHPDNILKYYNVTETFKSSTEQIYPKTIRPYYDYTPSTIQWIRNNPIVKDFQIYKMMNNNEFLKEHEKKITEQKEQIQKYIEIIDDEEKKKIEDIHTKSVLNEEEMIRLMREKTNFEIEHSNGNYFNNSQGNMQSLGNSLGGYDSRIFFDDNNSVNKRDINVVWSSDERNIGGADSLFGFEDDDDDGKMW